MASFLWDIFMNSDMLYDPDNENDYYDDDEDLFRKFEKNFSSGKRKNKLLMCL